MTAVPNLTARYECRARRGTAELLPDVLWSLETSASPRLEFDMVALRSLGARDAPLRRCPGFERALGARCEIYARDERSGEGGTHKALSAAAVCGLLMSAGHREVVTETTGHWGFALARCAKRAGIHVTCVVDDETTRIRPDAVAAMRAAGAEVLTARGVNSHAGVAISAEAALDYACDRHLPYVFGSVFGYFTAPQVLASIATNRELAALGRAPTHVIGSCGGGANLISVAGAQLATPRGATVWAAEAASCRILSAGEWGWHGIDSSGRYPMLETLGLPSLAPEEYLGGLATTLVSPVVARAIRNGAIRVVTIDSQEALRARTLFEQAESIKVALETSYQLAAVSRVASGCGAGDVILTTISAMPRTT